MSDDPSRHPPADPRTQLEDELVERARAPYRRFQTEAEQEGMRIFLNLFVKTHPAMQRRIERSLREQGIVVEPRDLTGAAARPVPERSTIVTKDGVLAATAEDTTDHSGVVAKDGGRSNDKAGGER